MRTGGAAALVILYGALALSIIPAGGCSANGFFRQYEYEEEIYLSLDGRATIDVNASVAAIDALRGASFDTSPNAPTDREEIRAWFTTPVAGVTRAPSPFRRRGRRFVSVRLEVDHIERLSQAAPFAWSSYQFTGDGTERIYKQTVGPAVGKDVGDVGWTGDEQVAFRLHLPSTIVYHNAGPKNLKRGNILVWEQPLKDRLHGVALVMDARMESKSILSRTLLLFGATFVAVAMTFGVILWWVVRRGVGRRTS